MGAALKTRTETVTTKQGQLKVVYDRATGEIIPEKIEFIRVPRAPGGADPEVKEVAERLRESGLPPEEIERRCIEMKRPVSRYTILAIRAEITRRPQNFTLTSIMMALGFDKTWTRKGASV